MAAHQALCPWDSPGKNTGVGCHFLLQCMKVKSESEATQSCPTLCDPMDCSLPGSFIHGIFQARVLEWGAIAFSIEAGFNESKKRSQKRRNELDTIADIRWLILTLLRKMNKIYFKKASKQICMFVKMSFNNNKKCLSTLTYWGKKNTIYLVASVWLV